MSNQEPQLTLTANVHNVIKKYSQVFTLSAILTIRSNEIPALQSPVTEKVEACAVSVRKTTQDPTVKGKKLTG